MSKKNKPQRSATVTDPGHARRPFALTINPPTVMGLDAQPLAGDISGAVNALAAAMTPFVGTRLRSTFGPRNPTT